MRLRLPALCRDLVDELDADASVVSRVLGDVLIQVAEHVRGGGTVLTGQGYLASDFPLTVEVLQTREPATVWVGSPEADPAEARLLRDLGYEGLLMLPLVLDAETWGLVEVYRRAGGFSGDDVHGAVRLVGGVAAAAATAA
jgi:GAF domain-containing protein